MAVGRICILQTIPNREEKKERKKENSRAKKKKKKKTNPVHNTDLFYIQPIITREANQTTRQNRREKKRNSLYTTKMVET